MTITPSEYKAPVQGRPPRYRKYDSPRLSHRFFGARHVLSLMFGILVLLVLLFPQSLINRQLGSGLPPSAATLAYLKLRLQAKPDQAALRLRMAQAELQAGQLEDAERSARPLLDTATPGIALLWLHIKRAMYVAAKPGSPERERARETYRQTLVTLAPRLGTNGLLSEIHHAVDSGLYDTAALLAETLLSSPQVANGDQGGGAAPNGAGHPDGTMHLKSLAGAAWSVSPSASAPSLVQAGPATRSPGEDIARIRREAFDALIASRLAAGDPVRAAEDAQRYIHLIPADQTDWPHLLQVARWANRPDIGAALAQRWLQSAGDPAGRWKAFNALIDAYLAGDKPRQALAAAEANLDRMPPSVELWRRMTRLAMQAGDANKTAEYARRMVHMGDTDAR